MTEAEWQALEARINDLIEAHARLREENLELRQTQDRLQARDQELRGKLEHIIERIKRLELETET